MPHRVEQGAEKSKGPGAGISGALRGYKHDELGLVAEDANKSMTTYSAYYLCIRTSSRIELLSY